MLRNLCDLLSPNNFSSKPVTQHNFEWADVLWKKKSEYWNLYRLWIYWNFLIYVGSLNLMTHLFDNNSLTQLITEKVGHAIVFSWMEATGHNLVRLIILHDCYSLKLKSNFIQLCTLSYSFRWLELKRTITSWFVDAYYKRKIGAIRS